MKYRRLGKGGPLVSAIGMGRGSYAMQPEDETERDFSAALQRALDVGINFFDSADIYWGTRHEALLGRALKALGGKVVIATKCGFNPLPDGRRITNGRPKYIMQRCEQSLRRLGVEAIDLYYLHRVDPATPLEETMGAMAKLVEQGKVRHVGICHVQPDELMRAHRVQPLTALQSEYSLLQRDCEGEILAACRKMGIAFIPYSPLARGLLTGRIRSLTSLDSEDPRHAYPMFTPENIERNARLVAQLEAMAEEKNATSAQLAIAWLLAQGDNIIPIPGTNHTHSVELNAAAVDIRLSVEELRRLNTLYAPSAGDEQAKRG